MRIVPSAGLGFLAAAAVFALAGCSSFGCNAEAETPTAAVTGFLDALPGADDPGDICQFVSEGWVVSQAELEELKAEFSPYEDLDLSFVEGDQLAGDITVDLVLDGSVEYTFRLTADKHTRWALDLGELAK